MSQKASSMRAHSSARARESAHAWRVGRHLVVSGFAVMLLLGASGAGAGATERAESSTDESSRASTGSAGSEVAGVDATDTGVNGKKKRRASRKELDARLDALLAEALPADEYRQTRSCLARSAYRKIEVLNEEYVLFSKGEEHWINRLRRRCPSLRFNDLPVFVQKGASSLCESDPFYPTNSMDLNASLSGGRAMGYQGICYLGDFEQISAEQAALIRGS